MPTKVSKSLFSSKKKKIDGRRNNGANSAKGFKNGLENSRREAARLTAVNKELEQDRAELHEEVEMLDWEKEQLQEEVGAADNAAEEQEKAHARAHQKHPPKKEKRKRVRKMGGLSPRCSSAP